MSQPVIATSVPTPFGVAAFDWWLAQVKHALPPTIFFFVGFNLILWTKRLILEDQGVVFSGFFIATAAALIHQAVSPAEVRKAPKSSSASSAGCYELQSDFGISVVLQRDTPCAGSGHSPSRY